MSIKWGFAYIHTNLYLKQVLIYLRNLLLFQILQKSLGKTLFQTPEMHLTFNIITKRTQIFIHNNVMHKFLLIIHVVNSVYFLIYCENIINHSNNR